MKKMLSIALAILMVISIIPFSKLESSAAAGDNYTKPNISAKYYTSTTNPFTSAGYSGQCTWFVWGRVWETLGIKLPSKSYSGSNSSELTNGKTYYSFRNNAYTWWYVNKGLEIYEYGQTPKENSIAVWDGYYGGVRTGHVAYVEYVDGDNVYFNEANYSKSEQYDGAIEYLTKTGMKTRGSFTLLGYIYVGDSIETTNTLTIKYSANGGTLAESNTYKTTDALNLRSSASTSSTVLVTIPEGTTITVTSTKVSGDYTWGKTTYDGETGWCALEYTTRQGYYTKSDIIYRYSNSAVLTQSWDYGTGGANGLWNASSFGLTREGYSFGGWSKDSVITDSSVIFDENDVSLKAEDIDSGVATSSKTVTLYAVWFPDETPVFLQSLEIYTLPDKTVYQIGESFDSTGLTAKLIYSDESVEYISSGFELSGFDSETAGTKTVMVTYGDVTNVFTVTVEEPIVLDTPQLKMDSQTAAVGEQISIPILVENADLSVLTFVVDYDSTKLEFSALSDIPFDMYDTNTATAGRIFVTCVDSGSVPAGTIVNITFNVIADSACETDIIVSVDEAYDENDNAVDIDAITGTISITDVLKGDTNGDGKVTAVDARWIVQYVASNRALTDSQLLAADVNGDGRVTAVDARWIVQYVAGNREF